YQRTLADGVFELLVGVAKGFAASLAEIRSIPLSTDGKRRFVARPGRAGHPPAWRRRWKVISVDRLCPWKKLLVLAASRNAVQARIGRAARTTAPAQSVARGATNSGPKLLDASNSGSWRVWSRTIPSSRGSSRSAW